MSLHYTKLHLSSAALSTHIRQQLPTSTFPSSFHAPKKNSRRALFANKTGMFSAFRSFIPLLVLKSTLPNENFSFIWGFFFYFFRSKLFIFSIKRAQKGSRRINLRNGSRTRAARIKHFCYGAFNSALGGLINGYDAHMLVRKLGDISANTSSSYQVNEVPLARPFIWRFGLFSRLPNIRQFSLKMNEDLFLAYFSIPLRPHTQPNFSAVVIARAILAHQTSS